MRVVGLISGGKDSIWNLHYCRQFGHGVVCVANLAPPAGVSEMDSYMYQTVGSDLIDSIAECLGLPLVRRVIQGEPKVTESQAYRPEDGDEVEDLTLLLKDVLQAHPNVEAVSCGAILSNYQRLRVESVCARLGLKVLAFLWKQEQEHLLRQMIDGGLDARIVKVASMGLTDRHVGKSILDAGFASYLFGLGAKWGVHVCGEGGEYESTVADAPLYDREIRFVDSETVQHDPSAGVALLQVARTETVQRDFDEAKKGPPFKVFEDYSSLAYYADTFPPLTGLAVAVDEVGAAATREGPAAAFLGGSDLPAEAQGQRRRPALQRVGPLIATSTLDAEAFGLPSSAEEDSSSAVAQCRELLAALAAWLAEEHGLSLRQAVFAEVQVRDLGCFEAVNAAYAQAFDADPPPRVCIETPLPNGVHVRLRLLLREGGGGSGAAEVEGLRVQSISTWAMACIGPYSQAFRAGGLLLSAGVLGLVPHTMALPKAAELDATWPSATAGGGAWAPEQWEIELWMLLRSLRNVLLEMRCDWADVRVAHVYVASCGASASDRAVRDHVLGYLRREAPGAAPLLTFTEQPRLPKDGQVEINVICAAREASDDGCGGGASEDAAVMQHCDLAAAPDGDACGVLEVSSVALGNASYVACADVGAPGGLATTLQWPALQAEVARCLRAALRALAARTGCAPKTVSLQVQHALAGGVAGDCFGDRAAHAAVIAAVEQGVQCAEDEGLVPRASAVVSYMPALSLGRSVWLRLIATAC